MSRSESCRRRTYGPYVCAICGKPGIKRGATQEICPECRKDRRKRERYYRERERQRAQAERAQRTKESDLVRIDRILKEQGLIYTDWSRAETIIGTLEKGKKLKKQASSRAKDTHLAASVDLFRFFADGEIAEELRPAKDRDPEALYWALVRQIRQLRAEIVVYVRGDRLYLVKK